MTREEMIRSFSNAKGRCKMQCPYSFACNKGNDCVFKDAALVMAADANRMVELKEQLEILKGINKLQLAYTRFMEDRCFDYYDMIHDYNGGVIKKLYISPKRKMAAKRKRRTIKAKKLRNRELMDGDPQYADIMHVEPTPKKEII